MARVTPQEAAQDWANAMQSATERYRRGVSRVQTAPGARAAAQVDAYRQGVADNISKWQRNVQKVSLADWQNLASTKGGTNLATGAAAARPKMEQAMAAVLADVDASVAKIQSMPSANFGQRKARAVAYMDAMHERAQSRNGR